MTRTVWYRVHCDEHQRRIIPGGSLLRWLDEHNKCNGRWAAGIEATGDDWEDIVDRWAERAQEADQ